MNNEIEKIGKIKSSIIKILNLDIEEDTPIFISKGNIEHIKLKHNEDYKKYGNKLVDILNNPTYVAKHPQKDSIEYIKKYKIDNEYVLIAVKVTKNKVNFVRTMFIMTNKKVEIYIKRWLF